VRRLVGNLDHPSLGAELQEPDPPKRLGATNALIAMAVAAAHLHRLTDMPFSAVIASAPTGSTVGAATSGVVVIALFYLVVVQAAGHMQP
jgi:hypothetical protein